MTNKDTVQQLESFALPLWNEIPSVGLYLDQTVKYVNGYLKDYPGMEITGSMVSNYVKLKILPKAIKKVYSREQIAEIFFVAIAKNILSMDEIRACFAMMEGATTIENGYVLFRNQLLTLLASFREMSFPRQDAKADAEEQILTNIVVAIAHKMYLDQFFLGKEVEEHEAQ